MKRQIWLGDGGVQWLAILGGDGVATTRGSRLMGSDGDGSLGVGLRQWQWLAPPPLGGGVVGDGSRWSRQGDDGGWRE
ncbi:hypothetical protein Dimus_003070, partial [Dionaea muscipula]